MKRPKSLAEARKRKGLTQEQLAAKIPTEPATLSRIENGRVQAPSLRLLAGLARVLGITVDEVLRLHGRSATLSRRNGAS